MARPGGHAQKSVFVHKPGKPKTQMRDAHIQDRLSSAQPTDPFPRQRLSRFLEAREIVDKTFSSLNERYFDETMRDVSEFVNGTTTTVDGRLPTVFLLKANINAYIAKIKAAEPDWHTISIHSKECPNLKSTIKLIVNRFTESDSHLVSDRRLTYDFHVLIDWLRGTAALATAKRLVVVVEDTDGFDPEIIRNLISHMHSYVANHELNFCLLLNLSVPLPLIEENLSQENVVGINARVLRGLPPAKTFIEECQLALYNSVSLRLTLSSFLVNKLHSLDIIQAFKCLQYAILGHFAGNPLASVNTTSQFLQLKQVAKLPSVVDSQDPQFLGKLEQIPFEDLAVKIPELQVGGKVLDIVFDPNYRPLIEQTLTDPRLYTKSMEGVDRMSVPITILYQLTRESSIYINIYDFYCAFKEMIKLDAAACSDRDRQSMAIFLETITSLKLMGILRDCKRKFECVEKVSWKGV